MTPAMQNTRPKFLELHRIRQPLPAVASILHRISGVGMFIFLPLLLWLLDRSLHSQSSFSHFLSVISNPLVKLVLIGLIWAFLHHLCAGIRHLALDFHRGVDLPKARASTKLVFIVSLALTALIGVKLW
jgi:succinate dehydrogenase / fumarate reductase cytochrome b subunit